MANCTIKNCKQNYRARGYCSGHYKQWAKLNPDKIKKYYKHGDSLNHLYALAKIEQDNCVLWERTVFAAGYGSVLYNGKNITASRAMLLVKIGEPPSKEKNNALHKPVICHNRRCVNYRHLYWGSKKQNNGIDKRLDAISKRKSLWHRKLTEDDVIAIVGDTRTHTSIAKEYAVTRESIRDIKSGLNWSWLTGIQNKRAGER